MPENWKPVKLAAKVIGHVSQGMYRTPAGAIKELISNAYDAGATFVKIHTGFPNFTEFSCEDDGCGISSDEFDRLMGGGIGDSEKASTSSSKFGRNGRPIIGRLGVGLLSLAQICPQFKITSYHPRSKKAFEASIKFPPYTRQQVDKAVREAEQNGQRLISTGQYQKNEIPYEKGKTGVTVTTAFVRDAFRRTMASLEHFGNIKFNKRNESFESFDQFLACIANPKLSALFFASPYEQLLFGLALASPIQYPDSPEHAPCILEAPEIKALNERLKSYDFRVEIDNILMRRPLVLPSTGVGISPLRCKVPAEPTKLEFKLRDGQVLENQRINKYLIKVTGGDETFQLYTFSYNAKVNGYPLQFSGYIFAQTTRLFPKEYQGLLIRVRNVAIGQYDVNFLVYPQAEGPRFTMVSSEIFVEEGLDDALKVDRDGFNTLDPQFIRLQAYIHNILHDIVFPGSWAEEKPRNKERRAKKERESISAFDARLQKATQREIKHVEIATKGTSGSGAIADVDRKTGKVTVYERHPAASSVLGKKKFKGVAAQVVAAFEVANRESTAEKRREVFYRLIEGVFQ